MKNGFRRFVSPWAALAAVVLMVAGVYAQQAAPRLEYPQTRKVDHVDTYHGTAVPDPYRWLEDDNSAETAAWVEAQNKVTFAYLERIPYRAAAEGAARRSSTTTPSTRRPVAQGRALLLHQERRPAEPERPLHPEGARPARPRC